MFPRKSSPTVLQQQPARHNDQQQQQAGSSDFQPKPAPAKRDQQMGEGSYEATRHYQKSIGEYLKDANVEADGQAARPHSADEARELEEAETEGKSHAKGE